MALPAILAGLGGTITAGLRFTENPVVAYFLVLAFLVADGGVSFFLNWQGVAGSLFTFVISNLGIPIVVYSWQVAIFLAIFPLIAYSMKH